MAFHIRNCVGTRDDRSFAVQWLACALPCRRFAGALTDVCARLRADVGRYSFIVRDLHPLLLAGLPAHSETLHRIGSRDSWFKSQSKGYQTRTTRFCGAIPRPIAGRLAIAYEEALAEIDLANSFSAANAGPPTNPPEARQRPGTR